MSLVAPHRACLLCLWPTSLRHLARCLSGPCRVRLPVLPSVADTSTLAWRDVWQNQKKLVTLSFLPNQTFPRLLQILAMFLLLCRAVVTRYIQTVSTMSLKGRVVDVSCYHCGCPGLYWRSIQLNCEARDWQRSRDGKFSRRGPNY